MATSDVPAKPDVPAEPAADLRLTVRDVAVTDRDAVRDLYGRLSAESIRRRFFSASVPSESFFDRLVEIGRRGGVGLVAETDEGDIVAEVGVERLANGNGELALTVDENWRGWLGPYLFAIAGTSAERAGMSCLELQVLTTNRPMRAITRQRGEALIVPSDWHDVRLLVSSVGRVPRWPVADRPRVLVETDHPSFDVLDAVHAAGWSSSMCSGRTSDRAIGARRCPVVDDRPNVDRRCPLAADADVVVVTMAQRPERDALLAHHRTVGVPVVLADGRRPLDTDRLVAAVGRVVNGRVGRADGTRQIVQTVVSGGSRRSSGEVGPAEESSTVPSGTGTASGP